MRNRQLIVETLPDPVPQAGQVLVKTLACGICGSDLHMLKHTDRMIELAKRSGQPSSLSVDKNIVMGHEFCAEIVDHGPDTAKTLKAGTRVCSMPVAIGPNGFGAVGYSPEYPGGYGEYMVLSEQLLLPVPNGLETERAALTEPMAVGYHAVQKARLEGNEVPLVIGCGPVGLAVIACLKLKGVGPIIAADFSTKRREMAVAMGADVVIDPAKESAYSKWNELGGPPPLPGGANPMAAMMNAALAKPCVMFECVGVPGVIQQMLQGAPRNARIVVAGACMEQDHFEPMFGINKEVNIQFVLGYTPEEFASALHFLAEGKLVGDVMITGKVGVAEVPAAFDELGNPERHAKILVQPWR
jgi:threonine dehydrogenase-like Zn-dependent dehydrogenase